MFIKEIDLFKGMGVEIIDEIFKISVIESHSIGDILFKQGDPAHSFYLLEQGEIRLSIGGEGRISFTMSPGDAFGWSSLAGRDVYTATAECKLPSKLIKIRFFLHTKGKGNHPMDNQRMICKLLYFYVFFLPR